MYWIVAVHNGVIVDILPFCHNRAINPKTPSQIPTEWNDFEVHLVDAPDTVNAIVEVTERIVRNKGGNK